MQGLYVCVCVCVCVCARVQSSPLHCPNDCKPVDLSTSYPPHAAVPHHTSTADHAFGFSMSATSPLQPPRTPERGKTSTEGREGAATVASLACRHSLPFPAVSCLLSALVHPWLTQKTQGHTASICSSFPFASSSHIPYLSRALRALQLSTTLLLDPRLSTHPPPPQLLQALEPQAAHVRPVGRAHAAAARPHAQARLPAPALAHL